MLITVGVLLDLMRQIETYLLQRHYDGFLKKGKIRGRSAARNKQLVDTSGLQNFWTAWRPLLFIGAALFILGIVSWLLNIS
jgi:preprotein translocase subunit SecY